MDVPAIFGKLLWIAINRGLWTAIHRTLQSTRTQRSIVDDDDSAVYMEANILDFCPLLSLGGRWCRAGYLPNLAVVVRLR